MSRNKVRKLPEKGNAYTKRTGKTKIPRSLGLVIRGKPAPEPAPRPRNPDLPAHLDQDPIPRSRYTNKKRRMEEDQRVTEEINRQIKEGKL